MVSRILLSAVLGFAVLVYLLTPVFYSGTVPDLHLDALRELVALFVALPSFLACMLYFFYIFSLLTLLQ